jgi:hypothetical protein
MTRCIALGGTLWLGLAAATSAAPATDSQPTPLAPAKYTLRYVFHPGETLRWKVLHRSSVRTTMSSTTQVAETLSTSVKAWRVQKVAPDGTATFEHRVEDVDMRQDLTGRPQVRYNSHSDKTPPVGFENLAEAVGATLAIITMDSKGKILERRRSPVKAGSKSEAEMTIPLPQQPVAVGESWTVPYDHGVTSDKMYKTIKILQKFTLQDVKHGVATIRVENEVLSPVQDPAVEAQLIECGANGTVRLDIDSGRILERQMDLDKRVVGFRGDASSIHYLTRFTEQFVSAAVEVAQHPDGNRAK